MRGRLRALVPYVMAAPGVAWLVLFFLVPILTLAQTSLSRGTFFTGFHFAWDWRNYLDALTTFDQQFIRSFEYAGMATLIALAVGYPLAYAIAFRGGRYKTLLLALVVLPFFTTYLIRTLAWMTILADEGPVVKALKVLHLLPADGRLLATTIAVVGGLTYNFLPFMVLPIYVALEKIEPELVDAARDLYASSFRAFRRVVLPLSMPGVFAGSLLTFIPAAGDFINAQLLGTSRQTMIGNVIQSQFLVLLDYPTAAALSFLLMAAILLAVFVYARLLGTEQLTG
ncbi:MAG TPA: ABC transporter permease [Actinomycetota bacterium]|nr:ABC transporter permease [Actinomycetota bacterium]